MAASSIAVSRPASPSAPKPAPLPSLKAKATRSVRTDSLEADGGQGQELADCGEATDASVRKLIRSCLRRAKVGYEVQSRRTMPFMERSRPAILDPRDGLLLG